MSLECVTVESGDAPVGSVIWMHGLGADAHDFERKLMTPGARVTLAPAAEEATTDG